MPLTGVRRVRTVFDDPPKKDSEQIRIRIPQPVERPFNLRRRDALRKELMRKSPSWYTLHKRGLRRLKVGEDYLESRAISKEKLRGTLPERIMYLYLVNKLHLKDGIDFDFQSSLAGGRIELGGIVADFRFELLKLIIGVDGPTHTQFLRIRKDEEQKSILESMGYKVEVLTDLEIYNETIFENKMRRIFVRGGSSGGGEYSQPHDGTEVPNEDAILIRTILDDVLKLYNWVEVFNG